MASSTTKGAAQSRHLACPRMPCKPNQMAPSAAVESQASQVPVGARPYTSSVSAQPPRIRLDISRVPGSPSSVTGPKTQSFCALSAGVPGAGR
jgi:hypothetical protein